MHSKPTVLALAIALTLAVGGCTDRTGTRSELAAPPPPPAESKSMAEQRPRDAAASGSVSPESPRREAINEIAVVDRAQDAQSAPPPMTQTPANAAVTAPLPPAPPAPVVGLVVPSAATPYTANTERYAERIDHAVMRVAEAPVSTFSIDVDTGSYSNVRRMLASGVLPPADAVRAEEFLNYFDHGYTPPRERGKPFSVTTELAPAPWDATRTLLLVGIKGYEVPREAIPPANLVFLIDTSGSMHDPAKLPLLVDAFKQMVPQLRAIDRVSIVVYAGSAGLVLEPTPGDQHARIVAALEGLSAGGSTAGGAGIELAYAMAREAYIDGGVNRVILATDGDFNVGTTDTAALESLVEDRRRSGIALSTLGFGAGNYNDELAERLADVGNGNHAYIDDAREARKVLVDEMSSTLMTIASDVKVQVEFNPAAVAEYRLIGYENRALRREDFNNDRIDAGEIGAGHDVTALYELTLVGAPTRSSDPLRYARPVSAAGGTAAELAFLKLRYKRPGEDRSTLVQQAVRRAEVQASEAGGIDAGDQRSEFLLMVRHAQALRTPQPSHTAAVAD